MALPEPRGGGFPVKGPHRAIWAPWRPCSSSKAEFVMYRNPVNKSRSASKFRRQTTKTKYANVKAGPMRGGIRL